MHFPHISKNGRGRDIACVAALGIVQAVLMMAAALATRIVFSALVDGAVFPVMAIAVLISVPVCLALVQAVARVLAEKVGQSFAIDLRDTVFRAIAALPEAERAKRSLGGLSLRFVGDMAAARGWAGLGITRLISAVIVLPAATLTLWLLNPALAVAGITPIALAMTLFVLIGRRLQRVHKNLRKGRANVAIWAMERIGQAHELPSMGRLERECKQLRKRASRAAADAVTRIRTTAVLRMIPNASLGLGSAAVLITALCLSLPTGETAAALAVLAILTIPLRQLVGVWDKHAAWTVARGKVLSLISRADRDVSGALTKTPLGVRFTNNDWSAPVEVAAGGVHVMPDEAEWPGCFDAVSGTESSVSMEYDGRQEPEIAFVSITPVILKGSLRRALTMGCIKRPDDTALTELCDVFGLTEIIGTSLDARVLEAGKDLTEAARLRISLIQAITRSPSIVVVDEALWRDPDAEALWGTFTGRCTSTIIAAPKPALHFQKTA